jgi:hypothetical protein
MEGLRARGSGFRNGSERAEVRGQERQQRIQHPTLNTQHPSFKDGENGIEDCGLKRKGD